MMTSRSSVGKTQFDSSISLAVEEFFYCDRPETTGRLLILLTPVDGVDGT